MQDWPHQTYALAAAEEAVFVNHRRICITSPTGGGKSLVQRKIIDWGLPTVLLCYRTMLFEQLARGLDSHGIPYDMQASGYAPTISANCQLGMIHTVERRWTKGERDLPEAQIVLVDEGHSETGKRIRSILDEYEKRGATVIFFTATPLGMRALKVDKLIQAGTTSDLRKCGALVPAHTFAPDEPDFRAFKKQFGAVLQYKKDMRRRMLARIFGSVLEHYPVFNPDMRPSILFAPDVESSRWTCDEFNKAGIPWSHVDSDTIILNGEEMPSSKETREWLRQASESGETKGVSNRFVLREGIDWPHLYHCIFACTFGGVTSYLQSGGRILRAHPSLDHVVVQDHGGNYHRFDSLNADRVWSLDDTDRSIQEKHYADLRGKKKPEPIVCPKCSKVRPSGRVCPKCGHIEAGRRRRVIQTDGTLREVKGDIYKPRRVNTKPDAHKKWIGCYFRALKSGKTFNQARGLFQHENNGTVPGDDFPLVPLFEADWTQHVADVPRDRLTPYRTMETA